MIVALGFLYPLLALYGFQRLITAFIRILLRLSAGLNETDIHLAVHPHCGPLWGNVSDVNAGVDLAKINTIVSFGDSYTDDGRHDGRPLAPAVIIPPQVVARRMKSFG